MLSPSLVEAVRCFSDVDGLHIVLLALGALDGVSHLLHVAPGLGLVLGSAADGTLVLTAALAVVPTLSLIPL